MKIEELRKQLVVRSVGAAGMLAAALVLVLVVLGIEDSKQTELNRVNTATRETNAAIQTTEQFLEQARKAMEVYAVTREDRKPSAKGIDQQALATLLDTLKERYFLAELSLKMTPPTLLKDNKELAKAHVDIEHTLVTLSFGGLSDELLFSFIDDLLRSMPRYVQVDGLQMERKKPLDDTFLSEVSQGKFSAAASGTLVLHWMAMKSRPTPPANGQPNAAP